MLKEDNIIQDQEYIQGMLNGIKRISNFIRPTYGGWGTNIIVASKMSPGHLITNDAQVIIKALKFENIAEKRLLALIKELCNKTDKESGNARKTTILLAEKILTEGYAYEGNKNQLKRDLDAFIPFIESEIDKQTKQITVGEVEAVATTASENADTGKLLKEIYQKIGKNGIIHPQGSGTSETTYKFIDGVRFDGTGFLSPYMAHDEEAKKDKVQESKAVYENPLILVTKKKILNDDDINPLLKEITDGENRNLVIFTQDMDSNVASMLIELHKHGGFTDKFGNFKTLNVLIIKAPVLWRDYVFEDFAKCTGATIIEDSTGKNFKNMKLSDLGTCGKIVVDAEETVLIGTKDITEHIKKLKEKGDDDSKLRLSWLTNKTAILKLGANSETDLSLKRLKCHDAIRSSELALKSGVVKGGGICLDSVADRLPDTPAGNILKTALKDPRNQQVLNSKTTDVPENIVDSAQTQKYAVRNAIGIASTILTANGYVYIPEKTPQEIAYELSINKNYDFQ